MITLLVVSIICGTILLIVRTVCRSDERNLVIKQDAEVAKAEAGRDQAYIRKQVLGDLQTLDRVIREVVQQELAQREQPQSPRP